MTLSHDEKDRLENAAAGGFLGNPSRFDSGNGFRVQNSKKGQMAAIYWNALHPGNEIEIAFPPALLAGAYSGEQVQGWVQWQRERQGRPCNVHKYGSDWPIIGFTYDQAIEFLKQVKLLRTGMLPNEILGAIEQHRARRTPTQVEAERLQAVLESLRPTQAHAVIDLVYRAGINVQPWFTKKDGTPAASPRSNAAYCFNWAFGGGTEPSLASVWHKSLCIVNGHIEMHANMRSRAIRLEAIVADKSQDRSVRETARPQAARARQLDSIIEAAFKEKQPVRVIINVGDMLDESALGQGSSVVRVRRLDTVPWSVESYDSVAGDYILRREDATAGDVAPAPPPGDSAFIADQYDLPGAGQAPEIDATGKIRLRNPQVRRDVLLRSQGNCELCNTRGFMLPGGRLYVETHHVVPLAEDGADLEWNVAALCPSHHREAHYGMRAPEIRLRLVEFLTDLYPERASMIGKSIGQAVDLTAVG